MKLKNRNATLGVYDTVRVEQLDSCNAFVRHCYKNYPSLGSIVICDELVSYCTPIIDVVYNINGTISMYKCAPAATCSNTTRKHVGKFLRKIGADICYLSVKDSLKQLKGQPVSIIDNQTRINAGYNYLKRWDIMPYEDTAGFFEERYESIKNFNPRY